MAAVVTTAKRRVGRPPGATSDTAYAALMDAARAILTERGGGPITLVEVAKRAGMNPAMVNYYFGSKSELLAAVIEETSAKLLKQLSQITPSTQSPQEKLAKRLRATMDLYSQHPYLSRLLKEQIAFSEGVARQDYYRKFTPAAIKATRDILEGGVESGDFRPVNPVFFWAIMVGICEFFFTVRPIIEHASGKKPGSRRLAEAYLEQATEILLYGLAPLASAGKPRRSTRSRAKG